MLFIAIEEVPCLVEIFNIKSKYRMRRIDENMIR